MTKIHHVHLYGDRAAKYDWLLENNIFSTDWLELQPKSPFYLLVPQDMNLWDEYKQQWKITDIMPVNSVGIVTARDKLTICWAREEIWDKVQEFISLEPEVARERFNLGEDARDWKIDFAQSDLIKTGPSESNLSQVYYRPFDVRHTYYTGNSRGFHCMPRGDVMKHIISGNNLAFHVCRQISIEYWAHILVSNLITDDCYVSNKTSERGYTIPLFLNPNFGVEEAINVNPIANFSTPFLKMLEARLGKLPEAESIFAYIYAILNSPTYRTRYIEFLKIDFPKIPFTSSSSLFKKIAGYGSQLIDLHLLREQTLDVSAIPFQQNGDRTVDPGHPKYANGKVTINKRGAGFTGIPQEVWEFYIGGYQVCHKWLKDRKGRTLSDDDILHYQKIIVALQETIRIMQQIDDAIPSWPIE